MPSGDLVHGRQEDWWCSPRTVAYLCLTLGKRSSTGWCYGYRRWWAIDPWVLEMAWDSFFSFLCDLELPEVGSSGCKPDAEGDPGASRVRVWGPADLCVPHLLAQPWPWGDESSPQTRGAVLPASSRRWCSRVWASGGAPAVGGTGEGNLAAVPRRRTCPRAEARKTGATLYTWCALTNPLPSLVLNPLWISPTPSFLLPQPCNDL